MLKICHTIKASETNKKKKQQITTVGIAGGVCSVVRRHPLVHKGKKETSCHQA